MLFLERGQSRYLLLTLLMGLCSALHMAEDISPSSRIDEMLDDPSTRKKLIHRLFLSSDEEDTSDREKVQRERTLRQKVYHELVRRGNEVLANKLLETYRNKRLEGGNSSSFKNPKTTIQSEDKRQLRKLRKNINKAAQESVGRISSPTQRGTQMLQQPSKVASRINDGNVPLKHDDIETNNSQSPNNNMDQNRSSTNEIQVNEEGSESTQGSIINPLESTSSLNQNETKDPEDLELKFINLTSHTVSDATKQSSNEVQHEHEFMPQRYYHANEKQISEQNSSSSESTNPTTSTEEITSSPSLISITTIETPSTTGVVVMLETVTQTSSNSFEDKTMQVITNDSSSNSSEILGKESHPIEMALHNILKTFHMVKADLSNMSSLLIPWRSHAINATDG